MKPQATHRLQVRTVVVRISRKLRATYRLRTGRLFSGLLAAMVAAFSPLARALPDTATMNVTAGQVNVDPSSSANSLVLNQGTNKAILDWRSFNIGAGESVRFQQLDASSVALNRITGGATTIYGALSANGQVFLVNSAGVLFAPGSQVNVGGLVASTLDLSNSDFLAGRYTFSGTGTGSVVNEGSLKGRYVVLAAPQVTNAGSIEAQRGSLGLLAGSRVSVDPSGAGLMKFSVDGAAVDAAITNSGSITADGGQVAVLASAISDTLPTVINQSGVIRANSIANENGTIVLSGGATGIVKVSGTLEAKGANAGETGGTVKVLGDRVGVMAGATVDASGDAGGGTVLVGGNFQGNGAEQNAKLTVVEQGATLRADATAQGDGGRVIVWADGATAFAGHIAARGGAAGGDGGFAEVSGKGHLAYEGSVDLRAAQGRTGDLLLDPVDLVVRHGAAGGTSNVNGVLNNPEEYAYTSSAAPSVITDGTINAQLPLSNVIVQTGSGVGGNGDITFDGAGGAIVFDAGGTSRILSFFAHRDITVGASTSYTNGSGALNLFAGSAGSVSVNAAVTNTGGTMNVFAGKDVTVNAAVTASAAGSNINFNVGQSGPGQFRNTAKITAGAGGSVMVQGGGSGNTFDFSGDPGLSAITVTGGSGTDVFKAPFGATYVITGNKSVKVGSISASGIETITGMGTANVLQGPAGTTYSLTGTNEVSAQGMAATGIGSIVGGGSATIQGPNADTNWSITGSQAVSALGVAAVGVNSVQGGTANDTFTLASGVTSFNGTLAGGGGTNTLAATNGSNLWSVVSSGGGTLNTTTSFSGMAHLTGGSGSDNFAFGAAGSISGAVAGGAGSTDALDLSAKTAVAIATSGTATGVGSFSGIEEVKGNNADTTLTGSSFVLSGSNSGTADGTSYSQVSSLQGAPLGNSFTGAGGSVTGSISDSGFATTLSGTLTSGGAQTYTGAVLLTGPTQISANGTITVGTSLAGGGNNLTIVSGGTTTLTNATGIGTFTAGTNGTTNGSITADTYNLNGGTVNASLGAGTLNSNGAVVLIGTSGATEVNVQTGNLMLATSERLADTTAVTVSGGALLTMGAVETIGSLAGAGNVTNLSQLWVGGNNTSTTYSGSITGGSLNKTGTGTLALTGSNTFTANTQVLGGTLSVNGNAINDDNHVQVVGTGRLLLAGSETVGSVGGDGTIDLGSNTLTTGGAFNTSFFGDITGTGNLNKVGTATFTLAGTNTYTGTTTISAGTLQIGAGGSIATSSGVTNNGTLDLLANATVAAITGSGGTNLHANTLTVGDGRNLSSSYAGAITGTGSVTKAGTGKLSLSGASDYSGGTNIAGGTLSVTSAGGAGTGTINIGLDNTLEVAGVSIANNVTTTSSATLRGTGAAGVSGAIAIASSMPLTVDTATAGDSLALSGAISGGGSQVSKTGAGTVTMTGTNTYSGATDVAGGTLRVNGSSLSDGAATSVATGATLELTGSETVGSLSGGGDIALGANTLTSGGNGLSSTYSGVASGTGGFAKAGAGTLTLTGSNTYTGGTSVNAGTLALGHATNTLSNSTAVSVASGATLDVGANADAVGSLALGGTLAGTGTLTAATYTLQGGTVNANLGAGTLAQASGTSTLNGTAAAGTVNVTGGTLALGPTANRLTAPASVTVAAGATLDTGTASQSLGTATLVNDGTLATHAALSAAGITGSGSASLGGNVTTTGAQSYGGPVQLTANSTVASTGGADITFGNTVDGAFALTVNTGGAATFQGAVGAATALASLVTDGTGGPGETTYVNGGVLKAAVVNIGDALGLNQDLAITAPTSVTFGSSIGTQAPASLTITSAATAFNGAVGASTNFGDAPTALTVNGAATLDAGDVRTIGDQVYNGPVTLASDTTFSSQSGLVRFQGTVDGAAVLTVGSGSTTGATGNVQFDAAVGGGTPLTTVVVEGTAALNGGTVATSGGQSYTGAVTLGADTTISGGTIGFGGTVTGPHALAVDTAGGGTTGFQRAVNVASLATNADGTTVVNADITTTGAQTYGDAVLVTPGAVLSAGGSLGATNAGNLFGNGVQFAVAQDGGGTGTLDVSGDFAGSTQVVGHATTVNLADTSAATPLVITGLAVDPTADVTLVSAGAMQVDAGALSPVANLTATTQNGDMVFLNSGTLRNGTPGVLATGAVTLNVTGGTLNTVADPMVVNASTPTLNVTAAEAYVQWEGQAPPPAPAPAPAADPVEPDALQRQATGVAGVVTADSAAQLATGVRNGTGLLQTERLVFVNALLPELAVGPSPFRITDAGTQLAPCAAAQDGLQAGCR